jgi:hypothetical protein
MSWAKRKWQVLPKRKPPNNNDTASKHMSPAKYNVLVSRVVRKSANRSQRVVDKNICPCLEEKPEERKNEGPTELETEGIRQVSGHLAKHLAVAFNFCGLGIDPSTTGMYLTISHLLLIRLELNGMGTEKVKLDWKKSCRLPLMSKSNYLKWSKNCMLKHKADFDAIGRDLYHNRDFEREIPEGLLLLMRTGRDELFKIDRGMLPEHVGNIIGFGANRTVYAAENDTIYKLSRFGARKHLEFLALTRLACVEGILLIRWVSWNFSYGDVL